MTVKLDAGLNKLAAQYLEAGGALSGGRVANPEATELSYENVAEFVRTYQAAGGDIDDFDEDQWADVLVERFGVAPEDVANYLEMIASWGVVDNEGAWSSA